MYDAVLELLAGHAHVPNAPDLSLPESRVRPLQILLAEDCLVNREVAVGLLELRGHQVTVANNGREAIDAFQRQEFDVVLMDVEMPDMDGLEATRIIRQWENIANRRTPIIAMTAHAVHGFQAACRAAGMDQYISKPIDPQKLYQEVESVIQQTDRHALPQA
jgi:CheY-like chemotaxis protein